MGRVFIPFECCFIAELHCSWLPILAEEEVMKV